MQPKTQSRLSTVSIVMALLLINGLSFGCQRPDLYETDEPTTIRPSSDTKIRPLAEEVAEYPRTFEAQAKQTVYTLQRAQQAHYLERKQFGATPEALSIGLELDSDAYIYQIAPYPAESRVLIYAIPKFEPLRSYTGVVAVQHGGDRLFSLICESDTHSTTPPSPTGIRDQITCPEGSTML
jgi:hypothetical protein